MAGNKRRLGKIVISGRVMFDQELSEAVFTWLRFVPYRAEYMLHYDNLECIGTSHAFDVIDEGFVAPEYRIDISVSGADEEGNTTTEFKAVRL